MNWAGLSQALRSKVGFEVADMAPTAKQIRLLGRAPQSRMGDMLLLIYAIETRVEQTPGWSADISKKYLKRNGKVVFGWRFIFQSTDDQPIDTHITDIAKIITTAPQSSRREIMEVPLIGATADRNSQSATGKGAGYMGQLKLGPQMKGG